SLNPTKISGTCGRLMCCLKYEQEAYEDLVKKAPKQESFVETPDGAGTVSSVNLLRQTVQVRLESAPETPKTYHNSELCVIRSGKGRRPEGYVEPPPEELEKLRRPVPVEERREEDSLAAALDAVLARRQIPEPEDAEAGKFGGRGSRRKENRRPKRESRPAHGEEDDLPPPAGLERRPPNRRRRRRPR
ncbi:MAG: hypothetical protein HFF50_10250, partial [Lawsonibacter sp.]|nr:hypothetical protein [Lawsonibacter sp.]